MPWVTNLTSTSATVTGVTPGSVHRWEVQGVDAQGIGSTSMPIVLVTSPTPSAPQVNSATRATDGTFQFTVQQTGAVVQSVIVEANSDLSNPAGWVPVGTFYPGSSAFQFVDTNSSLYPTRYYRIVAP